MADKYIIEYSHDNEIWFGFGASADKPPIEYTLDNAVAEIEHLKKNYKGLMRFVRIKKKDGEICLEDTVDVNEELEKQKASMVTVSKLLKQMDETLGYRKESDG